MDPDEKKTRQEEDMSLNKRDYFTGFPVIGRSLVSALIMIFYSNTVFQNRRKCKFLG